MRLDYIMRLWWGKFFTSLSWKCQRIWANFTSTGEGIENCCILRDKKWNLLLEGMIRKSEAKKIANIMTYHRHWYYHSSWWLIVSVQVTRIRFNKILFSSMSCWKFFFQIIMTLTGHQLFMNGDNQPKYTFKFSVRIWLWMYSSFLKVWNTFITRFFSPGLIKSEFYRRKIRVLVRIKRDNEHRTIWTTDWKENKNIFSI